MGRSDPGRFQVVDFCTSGLDRLPPEIQKAIRSLDRACEVLTVAFNAEDPRLPRQESVELMQACFRLKDALGLVPPAIRGPDSR